MRPTIELSENRKQRKEQLQFRQLRHLNALSVLCFLFSGGVGERLLCGEGQAVRPAGAQRSANAGMSSV